MWALLPWAWRLGIIGAAALALVGTVSGLYFKIRHDAVVEERAKVENEKRDAIGKAQDARRRIRELCDAGAAGCVPDDWFRDE